MTAGDLREIINDPDIPDDTPLRVLVTINGHLLANKWATTWEWDLQGAHGQLAGEDRYLALEIGTNITVGAEGAAAIDQTDG